MCNNTDIKHKFKINIKLILEEVMVRAAQTFHSALAFYHILYQMYKICIRPVRRLIEQMRKMVTKVNRVNFIKFKFKFGFIIP